jgi:O-antigen ligase
LVGIGLNQSPDYLPRTLLESKVDAVHNVVLHNAIEAGLLAGIAWLLLPVVAFDLWRRARARQLDRRAHRQLNWLAATLAGIYAGGQFTPALYEHVVFLLLGALAAEASRQPTGCEPQ